MKIECCCKWMDIRELTVCCLGSVLGALLFEEDGLMLAYEKLKSKLQREYTREASFLRLVNKDKYPYQIGLKAPTNEELMSHLYQVKAWQQSYERSPLAPYLVKIPRRFRSMLGEQNVLTAVRFPNRDAFEHFVAPDNCPAPILDSDLDNGIEDADAESSSAFERFNTSTLEQVLEIKDAALQHQAGHVSNGVQGPLILHWPRGSFRCFDEICELVVKPLYPALQEDSPAFALRQRGLSRFMQRHARQISEMGSDFVVAMTFVDYMASLEKTPNIYYRQLALPHMDTKFIERNYSLLNELLDLCLPQKRRRAIYSSLYPYLAITGSLVRAPFNEINSVQKEFSRNDANSEDMLRQQLSSLCAKRGEQIEAMLLSKSLTAKEAKLIEGGEEESGDEVDLEADMDFETEGDDGSNLEEMLNAVDKYEAPFVADRRLRGINLFTQRWGFKSKPEMVRLRVLDPEIKLGLCTNGFDHSLDLSLTLDAFAHLNLPFEHIIICENEVSFLSLPQISNTIAVFGSGYSVVQLGPVKLLAQKDVIYWGDLDTHGFAILNALRTIMLRSRCAYLLLEGNKQEARALKAADLGVRSMLMSTDTFLRNQEFWVQEKDQMVAVLEHLLPEEYVCYEALVSHKYGTRLRLEQELIPFSQVLEALQQMLPQEQIKP